MTTQRLGLRVVPLTDITFGRGQIVLTISVGQAMDVFHRVGYETGAYLLELDDEERQVCAYHKGDPDRPQG